MNGIVLFVCLFPFLETKFHVAKAGLKGLYNQEQPSSYSSAFTPWMLGLQVYSTSMHDFRLFWELKGFEHAWQGLYKLSYTSNSSSSN